MSKELHNLRELWISKSTYSKEITSWVVEAIDNNQENLKKLHKLLKERFASADSHKLEVNNKIRNIQKVIKSDIFLKEKSIEEISLNTPNSSKLQVSVPSNLNYLMKLWAAAEGRDLASVALQCLEFGLREMKSKGSIPIIAVNKYNDSCEKRVALAEFAFLSNVDKTTPPENEK